MIKIKSLAQIILLIIFMTVSDGCRDTFSPPTVLPPTPSNTSIPTSTPKPTSTSTPTMTPTETPTPIVEKDLQPAYVETVAQAYMDVEIKFSVITDASLGSYTPPIHRIYLNPHFVNYQGEKSQDALAHFVALAFYKLWQFRQAAAHTGSNVDFESYLLLWSQAQKSNNPEDWKKVQIDGVWANDLNDGNGYKQQEYTIWPMYTGDPSRVPEVIRAITEFSIPFASVVKMKNVTMFPDSKFGVGFNLDGSIFYLYLGLLSKGADQGGWNATHIMAPIAHFLIKNRGDSSISYRADPELYKLVNRHTNIGDCCYRAALKIDPPTRLENAHNP